MQHHESNAALPLNQAATLMEIETFVRAAMSKDYLVFNMGLDRNNSPHGTLWSAASGQLHRCLSVYRPGYDCSPYLAIFRDACRLHGLLCGDIVPTARVTEMCRSAFDYARGMSALVETIRELAQFDHYRRQAWQQKQDDRVDGESLASMAQAVLQKLPVTLAIQLTFHYSNDERPPIDIDRVLCHQDALRELAMMQVPPPPFSALSGYAIGVRQHPALGYRLQAGFAFDWESLSDNGWHDRRVAPWLAQQLTNYLSTYKTDTIDPVVGTVNYVQLVGQHDSTAAHEVVELFRRLGNPDDKDQYLRMCPAGGGGIAFGI